MAGFFYRIRQRKITEFGKKFVLLPDGGRSTDKSYYSLDIAYGGTGETRTDSTFVGIYTAAPFNFSFPGYYASDGSFTTAGTYATHATRSAGTTAQKMMVFHLTADGLIHPYADGNNSLGGRSIRCVAR